MRPDVLALIPARAGSRRVPRKNTRLLGGKPLAKWTIEAALAADSIGKVLLSTDDPDLIELAGQMGVGVLERPQNLAGDHASSVDVALHALDCERAAGRDWSSLCLLQPTSPFRAEGRIDEGLAILHNSPYIDAVVGVAEPAHHPLHCLLENPDGSVALLESVSGKGAGRRSQDLPRAWALTGSFYAIRMVTLRDTRSFLPPRCRPLACTAQGEDIDIDWPADFERAEHYLASLEGDGK